MKDNYGIARDRAQQLFSGYDHQDIANRWKLKLDRQFLYVQLLGKPYRIRRSDGQVIRALSGEQAEFQEVLTLFDLLTHPGEKTLSGCYAPVNSLKGRPAAAGVATDFFSASAKHFDADPERFCRACEALGGEAVEMGDIGFCFSLFAELKMIVKLYRGDEEFPPSLTVLWDENTLSYLLYETVFYAQGLLLQSIAQNM